MTKGKMRKGQTTIYKTHRKLETEQHEPHLKVAVNSDPSED